LQTVAGRFETARKPSEGNPGGQEEEGRLDVILPILYFFSSPQTDLK
jgi:hypothetical protein